MKRITQKQARLLFNHLERMTRSPSVSGPLDKLGLKSYLIGEERMTAAQALCASIESPDTYVVRARRAEERGETY